MSGNADQQRHQGQLSRLRHDSPGRLLRVVAVDDGDLQPVTSPIGGDRLAFGMFACAVAVLAIGGLLWLVPGLVSGEVQQQKQLIQQQQQELQRIRGCINVR